MHSTFLLFLALIIPSLASLTPIETTQSTLLLYGSAHTTHTYMLSTPSEIITSIAVDSPSKDTKTILSSYETRHAQLGSGVYNITIDLFFEHWVGTFDYAVVVNTIGQGQSKTYTHVDSHTVYGMVLYQSQNIVSGDEHQGVRFPHYVTPESEAQELGIMTNAPEGVDMTPVLTTRDTFSKASTLLPQGSVTLSNGRLSIRPAEFLTGGAVIDVLCPGLEIDGEVYETVIEVSVSRTPAAPVVLVSANGTFSNGEARIAAVLKNGDESVVLLMNGTELHGDEQDGKYLFRGNVKPGIYEGVGIRNAAGDGVVSERLAVEVVGDGVDEARTEGRNTTSAIIITVVIVAAVVFLMVVIAVLVNTTMSRRSRRMDSANIVDGRVEHIARDVYGRGSVHV